MSYSIEHGKLVVYVPAGHPLRQGMVGDPGKDVAFFLASWACNNVTPRSFDAPVLGWSERRADGTFPLPEHIFVCAYSADGGSIKPWSSNQSGLSYLEGWRRAAANAKPLFNGDEPAFPVDVSAWVGADLRIEDVPSDVASLLPDLVRTLKPGRERSEHCWNTVYSASEVAKAFAASMTRKMLPFSLCVEVSERHFDRARKFKRAA